MIVPMIAWTTVALIGIGAVVFLYLLFAVLWFVLFKKISKDF